MLSALATRPLRILAWTTKDRDAERARMKDRVQSRRVSIGGRSLSPVAVTVIVATAATPRTGSRRLTRQSGRGGRLDDSHDTLG